MLPALWRTDHRGWSLLKDFTGFQEDTYWTPSIDVVDGKNEVRILAEIPGINKEDIHVSVDGDVLTLSGEKKQTHETKENGVVRSERVYGRFYRALTLPQTLDADNIKAAYKHGVLELTLPKKEEAKPKQISVSVN